MDTIIPKEFSDHFKKVFLYKILECNDTRASTALYTYAGYLNKQKLQADSIPLYIEIFKTNNRYAIDVLLKGYDPRRFFNFIRVLNDYLMNSIFEILDHFKKNELYPVTVKIFCGLLKRFYRSGEAGYQMYPMSIANVNALGKYLDEKKSQDSVINRDILDILSFLSEMGETRYEADIEVRMIAKQAGRIRTDFFDNKRSLKQSLTENTLGQIEKPDLGIPPEGVYLD